MGLAISTITKAEKNMKNKNLSKIDRDFAHAMALKLRLNRQNLAEKEKQQRLIEEAGEFRMAIVGSAMKEHPNLTVEAALEMLEWYGG